MATATYIYRHLNSTCQMNYVPSREGVRISEGLGRTFVYIKLPDHGGLQPYIVSELESEDIRTC